MATPDQYAAAAAATLKIIQADIDQDVPMFFRDEIPASALQQLAADTAKAALDAVLAPGT